MSSSLVYQHAAIYEAVMLALYGRHYFARHQAVAELIPAGASVVDVCCGPGTLYRRHLKQKSVDYRGLDLNRNFVEKLKRAAINADVWDVQSETEFPSADFLLMQASLYHFLPEPWHVMDRMLRAARKQVIIAEPVRNLADSRFGWLAGLAGRLTDPGSGTQPHRFTEKTLDELFARYQPRVARAFLLPGGREKVYLLNA